MSNQFIQSSGDFESIMLRQEGQPKDKSHPSMRGGPSTSYRLSFQGRIEGREAHHEIEGQGQLQAQVWQGGQEGEGVTRFKWQKAGLRQSNSEDRREIGQLAPTLQRLSSISKEGAIQELINVLSRASQEELSGVKEQAAEDLRLAKQQSAQEIAKVKEELDLTKENATREIAELKEELNQKTELNQRLRTTESNAIREIAELKEELRHVQQTATREKAELEQLLDLTKEQAMQAQDQATAALSQTQRYKRKLTRHRTVSEEAIAISKRHILLTEQAERKSQKFQKRALKAEKEVRKVHQEQKWVHRYMEDNKRKPSGESRHLKRHRKDGQPKYQNPTASHGLCEDRHWKQCRKNDKKYQ